MPFKAKASTRAATTISTPPVVKGSSPHRVPLPVKKGGVNKASPKNSRGEEKVEGASPMSTPENRALPSQITRTMPKASSTVHRAPRPLLVNMRRAEKNSAAAQNRSSSTGVV